MSFIWTQHIKRRMVERRIEREDVEHALAHQTMSWTTTQGSIEYIGPSRSGRELTVWVVAPGLSSGRPILKSVAWKDGD